MSVLKFVVFIFWIFHRAKHGGGGSPYPEVTDAILQSSLTQVVPIALVYSTIPPVLVCGTVS